MSSEPEITVTAILDYFVRTSGDTIALKSGDKAYTFSEWDQQATGLAESLSETGVGPGDRVAILAYTGVEQFIVLFATMKLGALLLARNPPLGIELMYPRVPSPDVAHQFTFR